MDIASSNSIGGGGSSSRGGSSGFVVHDVFSHIGELVVNGPGHTRVFDARPPPVRVWFLLNHVARGGRCM